MNYPARLFRDLLSTWHQSAESSKVDMLAAELTSCIAREAHALCIGLVQKDSLAKLHGLMYLLDSYGLVVLPRYRKQGDSIFVFLDRKSDSVSEYADSTVTEHYKPAYTLARAA